MDLDDLDVAQEEARKALRDVIWDELPARDRRDFTVDVKNTAGEIVWRVTLSLVVETPSQGSTAST